MKCLLVSSKQKFSEALVKMNIFSEIISEDKDQLSVVAERDAISVVIIDGTEMSLLDIDRVTSRFGDAKTFYLSKTGHETGMDQQMQFFCLSKGITYLSSKLTIEEAIENIRDSLNLEEKESSNVICLCGANASVGVTTIGLELATRLAAHSIQVGWLSLNLINPGDTFFKNYKGRYLDETKKLLTNRFISKDNLKNSMDCYNGFMVLAGNREIREKLYYAKEEVELLINTASNIFDIVILDAGCQFDNAFAVQSILSSNLHLLITDQRRSSLSQWNFSFRQIIKPLGLTTDSFSLLVNRYRENAHYNNIKQLQLDYGVPVMQTISDIGDIGLLAEQNQELPSNFGPKVYNESIHQITRNIATLYKIPIQGNVPKRQGILGRLLFS